MILLLYSLFIDAARFMVSRDTTYCEIYWSEPYTFFGFSKEGGSYSARFSVEIEIQNNDLGQSSRTILPKRMFIQSTEGAKHRKSMAVDVIPIFLLKGFEYTISLVMRDSLTGNTDTASINVVPPEWEGLSLSDIQLTHTMKEADFTHPFVKNEYFLIPYPEAEFSRNSFLLGYYSELYNIEGDSVEVEINILSEGGRLKNVKKERYKNPGGSMVIAGVLNLLGIPPGKYNLEISARDGGHSVVRRKGFTLLGGLDRKFVRLIPDDKLEYAMFLNYLLPSDEFERFNRLPDSAKIIYIERFWKRQDPTPGTPKNEALEEYIKRVKYADEHFSRFNTKGRFTEMGRILIKYGIPDEVVDRRFETGIHPYTIWYYHAGIAMEFIFVDKEENGNYELVYSSVKDEPYDPNWESYILPEDRANTISR